MQSKTAFEISLVFLFGLAATVQAQESIPGTPIVCYGSATTQLSHQSIEASGLRTQQQTATFVVSYTDFPEAARAAFQRATAGWSTLISSPIPIHVQAIWAELPGNALASTSATKLYRGFAGAVQPDVWYPVALAEKLTGRNLNDISQADIRVTINSRGNWYPGLDGNTSANQVDLLSVVLHEMAHGLGFASSVAINDSVASLRDTGYLLVYDVLLANQAGMRTSTFQDPSTALLRQLTSNSLYLNSPMAANVIQGLFPKIFAPPFYNPGGSISHLDESTYPTGDPNALMTPFFANGESIHTFGTLLPAILADLGWRTDNPPAGGVAVYPNPTTGLLTVKIPGQSDPFELRILNLTGQLVRIFQSVSAPTASLDLADLPNGLYFLEVPTVNGVIRKKLILTH